MADGVADGVKAISFDIFDTLVLRPFAKPSDLFYLVEQESGIVGFHDKRIKAESDVRRKKRSEITLDEIYAQLGLTQEIKDLEIEIEKTVCFKNEAVCSMLESYGQNYQILLISDMYLPREVIESILDKLSIRYDRLYISSEAGKTKHHGDLFDLVLSDLGIKPDELLHIGDNKRADVRIPESKGIRTRFIESPISCYLRTHYDERRYLRRNHNLTSSILIALDAVREENDDIWYDIGNRYGGPLAYSYCRYLMDVCENDSLIAFVSRDGYSLERCLKILEPDADTCYLHLQRLLNDIFFNKLMLTEGDVSYPNKLGEFTPYLKMEANLRKIMNYFSELFPDGIPDDSDRLISLFNEKKNELNRLRLEQLELFKSHVIELCRDKNMELVDCTTMKFSSQRFLERILERKVKGHYSITLSDSSLEYDSMYRWPYPIIGWSRVNLPEFLLCSPELPICGWNDDDPVYDYEAPEWEKERAENYPKLSDGICDYSQKMASIFGKHLPMMDYSVILPWVMLSSAKGTKYRVFLQNIKWASNTDHSDWSPIIPWDDVKGMLRRYAIDILSMMDKKSTD